MAVKYGASALGLVAEMPSGPGPISDEKIRQIARTVPPPISTFLLTSRQTAEEIIDHHRQTFTTTIQIVDELAGREYEKIRTALPAIKLVQVIHVVSVDSATEACEIAPLVDAILLDSGNPGLAVKELGGTGRQHDWDLSSEIVKKCGKPVFLAGGLNTENVNGAIRRVEPFGLDICSGVRTDGRLDEQKLRDFFSAVAG